MNIFPSASARRVTGARHPIAVLVCCLAAGLASGACATDGGQATPLPGGDGQPTAHMAEQATEPVADRVVEPSAPPTPSTPTDGERVSDAAGGRAAMLARMAGVPSVTIVEDWAAMGGADAIERAISRNLGQGENTMVLSTITPAGAALPSGGVLALTYDIRAPAPDDFVGFNRDLGAPADWSGASAIAVWVDGSAAADANLVLQFRERSGEVWRHAGPMPAAGGDAPLVLSFDKDTFDRTDWSTADNDAIDVDAVDQYGLYVGHIGPGTSGVVQFGPIVVMR